MDFIIVHQNDFIIGIICSLFTAALIGFISWMRKWPPLKVPLWVIALFISIPLIFTALAIFKTNEITPVVDQKFELQRIVIDGKKFIRCEFDRCILVFRGENNFGMEQCSFIAPDFIFESYASITVSQIRIMWDDPAFQSSIKNMIGIKTE